MRRKPAAHISREGIALARLVGAQSGPFNLVVTSTIPRAIETAIAMGFEVDQTVEELGHLPREVGEEIGWPSLFARIAEAVAARGPGMLFAAAQARLWRGIVERLPDGGRALVISHGLIVELGAMGSLPDADHAAWGDALGYCEGVRLVFDGDRCSGEILRVPEAHRLINN